MEFGKTEVRDLKPDGRNLPVTEENKKEYVHLVCQEKMTGAIRQQLRFVLHCTLHLPYRSYVSQTDLAFGYRISYILGGDLESVV